MKIDIGAKDNDDALTLDEVWDGDQGTCRSSRVDVAIKKLDRMLCINEDGCWWEVMCEEEIGYSGRIYRRVSGDVLIKSIEIGDYE